jgi:hypothetical protein
MSQGQHGALMQLAEASQQLLLEVVEEEVVEGRRLLAGVQGRPQHQQQCSP